MEKYSIAVCWITYSETGSWKTAAYAGLMSGVTTGLSAGLAGAVSNAIPVDGLARTIAHGVAQGTVSVLQGGKFGHGFISGSIGHAAKGLGTRLGFGQVGSEQGLMARTMVSALVGGTVSQLTGGKFANGAMTAAFVHLFNAEANSIQERMNRLAEEISKRGYFKSKGEADWLYQNNANPDLRVSIDASRLTVEVTKGSNWYRDNVLGGWSAWGEVGEGGTFNTDFQIYGTVKVNTATGFIRIMPEEYNFEMKPWNTHFMRNIKTIIASPGLVGTSFWTDFRGVPNVR